MKGFPTKGQPSNVEWRPNNAQNEDVEMGEEQDHGPWQRDLPGAEMDWEPPIPSRIPGGSNYGPVGQPFSNSSNIDVFASSAQSGNRNPFDRPQGSFLQTEFNSGTRPTSLFQSVHNNTTAFNFPGVNQPVENPIHRSIGLLPSFQTNLSHFTFPGIGHSNSQVASGTFGQQNIGQLPVSGSSTIPFIPPFSSPHPTSTSDQQERRIIADLYASQSQRQNFALEPLALPLNKRGRDVDGDGPNEIGNYLKRRGLSSEPVPAIERPIAGNFGGSRAMASQEDYVSKFYGLLDMDDDNKSGEQNREFAPITATPKAVLVQTSPYVGLDFEDSIRVLRLDPGTGPTLKCRLQTIRLYKLEQSYEAISYVWGDTSNQIEVETPDGSFRITRNLSAALHRLRHADKPRYIWADAICINQDDIEERGHQVRLMRSVYRRASNVLVWLGPDSNRKSILAFSVICSIASGGFVNGNRLGQANFYSNGISSVHIPDLPCRDGPPDPSFKALWGAVKDLFANSWFWRVWCIQEAALARTATVIWGKSEISWRWLGLAAARLRINFYNILEMYKMPGVYNTYLMYRISQGELELDPLRLSFSRLLSLTRQFEATDARDRIFGLLGIPTTDSNPDIGEFFMEPDYSRSALEIYTILARRVLRQEESLDLLSSVQHGDELDTTWPTWIPRWDKVYSTSLSPSELNSGVLGASRGAAISLRMSESHDISIEGVHPFVVATIFPTRSPSSNHPYIDDKLFKYAIENPGHERGRPLELCWTLTAGKRWDGFQVSNVEEHLADFASYLNFDLRYLLLVNKVRGSGDKTRFIQAASNACNGRRLFITNSGHLGLGPAAMRSGDFICVLFGAIMPFVLRPAGDNFFLVGECYVYHLMGGQATQAYHDGRLNSRDFLIR